MALLYGLRYPRACEFVEDANRFWEFVNGHLLLIHVDHEVFLAFKLPRELGRRDVLDRALLALDLLVRLHI